MKKLAVAVIFIACGGTNSATPTGDAPIGPPPIDAPAHLEMAPDSIDFGTVVIGARPTMQAVVKNTGGSPSGELFAYIEGPDAVRFFVAVNGCATLDGTGMCAIDVGFAPRGTEAVSAMLVVTDGTTKLETALTGGGIVGAALEIDHESYIFDPAIIGPAMTNESAIFTITNVGSLASGSITTLFPGGQGSFVYDDGCGGQTLGAGNSCTVRVTFTPTDPHGSKSAGFTAQATPGGMVGATFSGTALNNAKLVLEPGAGLDFGFVPPNLQYALPTLLTNTGDIGTGGINYGVGGGSNGFQFLQGNCTPALAQVSSCNPFVRFTSAGLGGTRASSIIASAAPGGTATIMAGALTTTNVSQVSLRIVPGSWDFGSAIGGSLQTFTVQNEGTAAGTTGLLKVVLMSSEPMRDFTIKNDNCTGTALGPMQMCTVDVMAAPIDNTQFLANLVVYSQTPLGWAVAGLKVN